MKSSLWQVHQKFKFVPTALLWAHLCGCGHASKWSHGLTASAKQPESHQEQQNSQIASITMDDSFRYQVPAEGSLELLQVPKAHKTVLSNGLTVLTIGKNELPLVYVGLVIKAGSAQDPAHRLGLAKFFGDMLTMGSKQRSAKAIALETENLGSSIEVEVDVEKTTLWFKALKPNVAALMDILADMALHPAWQAAEITRLRGRLLASLMQAQDEPEYTAVTLFRRLVFGEQAYNHMPLGNKAGINHIGLVDLQHFYAKHMRPSQAAVVVVGQLDQQEAVELIKQHFHEWHEELNEKSNQPPVHLEKLSKPELAVVHRPDAAQSQIVVGHLSVPRQHPDYYALLLCNTILGGSFNSRINSNLREDKGYTYGTYSHFSFMKHAGVFAVAGGIRSNATGPALREIFKEIAHMQNSLVTEEELHLAKNRFTLAMVGQFQTVHKIGQMFGDLFAFGLPLDYYQQLPSMIKEINADDILRVAKTHLHPDAAHVVVAGDAKVVADDLVNLGRGPIVYKTASGRHAAPPSF